MGKPVILTGLRANNDLTIGNYFGGILPMIDMATTRADEFQINLFVPDLHSFTTPIDHSVLQEQIWNNLRLFAAAGLPLDHPDIHIYRQSYIPAHSELTWILDCFTGFGEMSRMPQYKEKTGIRPIEEREKEFRAKLEDKLNHFINNFGTEKAKKLTYLDLEKIDPNLELVGIFGALLATLKDKEKTAEKMGMGLLNYPVLMAADILLYGATYVPVGDDQTQHLEFTRDIGERMNSRFGDLFTIPKPVKQQHAFFNKDQGLRIKDLQDPSKKMSKSDENDKGVVFLGDDPEVAAKKIMSAATDSVGSINFDWENQPGVTNLLQLLALLSGREQSEVNSEWTGRTSYGELKSAVAEEVKSFLQNLQSKLAIVDNQIIESKLVQSEAVMSKQASDTLLKVQKAVGLR